jgi:hypothetical protein
MLEGQFDATPDPVVALRLTLAAAARAVDRLAADHPQGRLTALCGGACDITAAAGPRPRGAPPPQPR